MVTEPIFPFAQDFPEYIVTRRLDAGSERFETFEATTEADPCPVRLTCVMPDRSAPDAPSTKQFVKRLERLRSLAHPGLPRFVGGGERRGVRWVALSSFEHMTLREMIDSMDGKRLPAVYATEVAIALGSALALASQVGIYHGDLRIEAIAIPSGPDALAVLLELGFVQLFGASVLDHLPTNLSPEQILGRAGDARSDMYALGMVLYELLLGRPAFSRADGSLPDAGRLGLMHLQKDLPSLKSELRLFPEGLSDFVARLTAKAPEDRFPTWLEAIKAATGAREGYYLWRDVHSIAGLLGPTRMRAIKSAVDREPFTGASSGHRYSDLFNEGRRGLPPAPRVEGPSSEPDSEDEDEGAGLGGSDAVVLEAMLAATSTATGAEDEDVPSESALPRRESGHGRAGTSPATRAEEEKPPAERAQEEKEPPARAELVEEAGEDASAIGPPTIPVDIVDAVAENDAPTRASRSEPAREDAAAGVDTLRKCAPLPCPEEPSKMPPGSPDAEVLQRTPEDGRSTYPALPPPVVTGQWSGKVPSAGAPAAPQQPSVPTLRRGGPNTGLAALVAAALLGFLLRGETGVTSGSVLLTARAGLPQPALVTALSVGASTTTQPPPGGAGTPMPESVATATPRRPVRRVPSPCTWLRCDLGEAPKSPINP